ncbi:MAG: low molecular weight phosphatase family protein [Spongiibacteraceae bacterium]|nr:low molecular weight phosphatase family protein [Spongiibacteraceae bacterium]
MKILYICTHNRCRSILSEAISNQRAEGLLVARSAGSQPAGEVHPLSLRYLAQRAYRTEDLQSQSWDAFEDFAPDLVVTVCDSAAGEACPLYFGKSVKVHWGLSDPSKIEGSEAELEQAFMTCIDEIERRVDQLIELAKDRPSPESLRAALTALGAS